MFFKKKKKIKYCSTKVRENNILSPKQSLIIGSIVAVEMTTLCDPEDWLVWLSSQKDSGWGFLGKTAHSYNSVSLIFTSAKRCTAEIAGGWRRVKKGGSIWHGVGSPPRDIICYFSMFFYLKNFAFLQTAIRMCAHISESMWLSS